MTRVGGFPSSTVDGQEMPEVSDGSGSGKGMELGAGKMMKFGVRLVCRGKMLNENVKSEYSKIKYHNQKIQRVSEM